MHSDEVGTREGEDAARKLLLENGVVVETQLRWVVLRYGGRTIGRGSDIAYAAEAAIRRAPTPLLDDIGMSLHLAVCLAADFPWVLRATINLAENTETLAEYIEDEQADLLDEEDEAEREGRVVRFPGQAG